MIDVRIRHVEDSDNRLLARDVPYDELPDLLVFLRTVGVCCADDGVVSHTLDWQFCVDETDAYLEVIVQ